VSVIERVVEDDATGMRGILVIDSLKANKSACGGIRITPDISLEETRLIARSMTEKYALFGFSKSGGAKAMLAIAPETQPEKRKQMLQAFARANKDLFLSRAFIPWTDMGACPADIHAMLDAVGLPRYPIEHCGMTTAWSVFGSILGVADTLGVKLDKCTAALEGFGNVGGVLAQELSRAGCKVIAVSTSDGAVYDPAGLDVTYLLELQEKRNSAFALHTKYRRITQQELLELPVTFLVPGARPHSITAKTYVRAKAIVPAANAPYTDDAAGAQAERGVLCLPAELCYSGGHIGSRFLRYGFSESEARTMTLAAWRELARHMITASAEAGVSPDTYCRHIIRAIMATLKQARFVSRAFEHALRSPKVPALLRRMLGRWYARHCFRILHKRIDSAASFFGQPPRKNAPAKYAVVSAVRDEEEFIENTVASVANQTVLPVRWVIVDDGSTDRTPEILADAARLYPWITVVTLPNRGFRSLGEGEVDAFNAGLARLENTEYYFLAKLDGDVLLPPRYFSSLFARFADHPRLGIASGAFPAVVKNRIRERALNPWNTAAHARMYRRECFEDIGGLARCLGFDTIDELKAQMRGWTTQSFKEVRGIHLRPAGSSTGAWQTGLEREGRAAYWCGAHPAFALARGIRELARLPVLGGLFFLKGYFSCWLTNAPQYGEQDVRDFARKRQLRRLILFGS
jgi:glutamate dehydrogenase/leucine dehydrogenase